MNEWYSEQTKLPRIGERVFICRPREDVDLWDIHVGFLAADHEGVVARPVPTGTKWPTQYYWVFGPVRMGTNYTCLITGNGWWAPLSAISLPPGARHQIEHGYSVIRGEALPHEDFPEAEKGAE